MILDTLDSINSRVRRMNDELADMKEAQRESGAASSIGGRQIVGSKQIVGSVDALLQLKKSLERAAMSCEKGAQFAQAMADSFRAEGMVIRGAYDVLDAKVNDSLRSSIG